MSDKKPVNAMYGTKMSLNLDKIKNKSNDEVVEETPAVEQVKEPVVEAPVEETHVLDEEEVEEVEKAPEEVEEPVEETPVLEEEEVEEVVEKTPAPKKEDKGVKESVETSVDYNVVSKLKKELSEKNEKLSNQSNELNYLTNKVIPRLKKENSELKSVKIELTDALEKSTRKYFDQLDINEDLSNEIGKLGADGAVNKVRADKLEAELETIKSDYESKISDLKDELNSKDIHEVDKLKEQNKTLKHRIEELNNDIDSLKDENNGLNSEIAELRKDLIEIGNYKEEVDKQNKDAISKYKEEISSLTTQLKVKESSYDKLSNENNKTITDLRKQVKKLEEQLEKESNKGLFNRFK